MSTRTKAAATKDVVLSIFTEIATTSSCYRLLSDHVMERKYSMQCHLPSV